MLSIPIVKPMPAVHPNSQHNRHPTTFTKGAGRSCLVSCLVGCWPWSPLIGWLVSGHSRPFDTVPDDDWTVGAQCHAHEWWYRPHHRVGTTGMIWEMTKHDEGSL